jgi:ligand-binding sensor domain-containing protein
MCIGDKHWGCLLGLWLLAMLTGQSQPAPVKFSYVTKPDALGSAEIMAVEKDKAGNMWLGTLSGLYRFDGQHIYKFSKSANGIVNSSIISLCTDSTGNIWGGTAAGIFRYNAETQQFKNYSTLNIGDGPGIEEIICTSSGQVFAAGILGLLRYDVSLDSFLRIGTDTLVGKKITINRMRKNSLVEDPSGKGIWIATQNGLNYYDIQSGQFFNHFNQPGNFLFNDHAVRPLARSPKGHLWLVDNTSFEIIGFKHGLTKPLYRIKLPDFLQKGIAASLVEDGEHNIWLASLDGKMTIISGWEQTPMFTPIKYASNDPNAVITSFFWDALEDEDGTLWLGTLSGLAKTNARRDFYKMHLLADKVPALQKDYAVAWVTENKADSSWWIALLYDNIIRYQPATGEIRNYDLKKAVRNKRGELPGRINQIAFFNQSPVVNSFNGSWIWQQNKFVPFTNVPPPYTHLNYSEMVADTDGSYWLSDTKTLVHWMPVQNKAEAFSLSAGQQAALTDVKIHRLKVEAQGILWMALNNRALAYFDKQSRSIKIVSLQLPEEAMQTSYFYNYDLDPSGNNIWIPYSGFGLVKVGDLGKQQSWWSDSVGFRSSTEAVLSSNHGQVWGFSKHKITVLHTKTNSLFQYLLPYGNHSFNYTVFAHRLHNGHLLANVGGNLVEYMPERILGTPINAKVNITAVQIGDKEKLLFGDTVLQLQPDENFLTFQFASLTDQQLFPYELRYKLENLDAHWKNASATGNAVYTQLRPGHYIFKVVMAGKNGEWISKEQRLHIYVAAPFYKTNWFIFLVFLLIAGLLYYWYAERMAQQKKLFIIESKAQLLSREKTQVQYENLKQHLNPHFLFNSLTTLSSLIEINPKMAGSFLRSLSKTYRYILQSKDKETVPLADELSFVQTFITLQQTRFEQGLQVVNNVPSEYLTRHIVPVTLQNLIENAIKHNIIDDENVLRITMEVENDYLVVANKMQLKKFVETSNKQGLDQLQSLYAYLTDKPLTYGVSGDSFIVKIPLL